MRYISVREAAKQWDISERRVRILCAEGRVEGAERSGWAWNIPSGTPKPGDGRALRHIKNIELRPGMQNFQPLDAALKRFEEQATTQTERLLKEAWSRMVQALIRCAFATDDHLLSVASVQQVCSRTHASKLSFDDHVLILNFKTICDDALKKFGFGSIEKTQIRYTTEICTDQMLKALHRELLHGLEVEDAGVYRDELIPAGGAFSSDTKLYPVSQQMETLFVQYDRDWSALHPLVRGVFFFGELMRISPFSSYNGCMAWLALTGELLAAGYPPAVFDVTRLQELKAALSLTLRRGNYHGVVRMIEDSVMSELHKLTELCIQDIKSL